MALSYFKYKQYEHLFDDDLVEESLDAISEVKEKMSDYMAENHTRKICPVCNGRNIRYSWNQVICNDCGWGEDIDIPYKAVGLPQKLTSTIKQRFGLRIAKEKNAEDISEKDTNKLPIDLMAFDTGEYSDQEQKYLEKRLGEILNTDDVHFTEKDMAIVHFLVLQELKIKDLYRKEAVSKSRALDKDFTNIKKSELSVYGDLKDDLEEIIERQRTDEKELSVYSKVNEDFDKQSIKDMIQEIEQSRTQEREAIEESDERRKKLKSGDLDIEKEIEEVVGDADGE